MNALTDVEEHGWKEFWTDAVLTKFSDDAVRPETARFVIMELLEAIENGNSCIRIDSTKASDLGGLVSCSPIRKAPFFYDQELLYLDRHFNLEAMLAENIRRIAKPGATELNADEFIHLLTDEHQRQSLLVAFKNSLSIITGGPGTGKTYTLSRIIASLNKVANNPRIAMAAPTGKAAQRMQEALQNAFTSDSLMEAGLITEDIKSITPITIHRLLGMGFSGKPEYNSKKKLPFDIIVIDEASMLDLKIAAQFFSAVEDGTKVILLGDPNQLASVDVGGVLADLKASGLLKNCQVQLEKSVRFTGDSQIGKMAKFIQHTADATSDQTLVSQFSNHFDGLSADIDYLTIGSGSDFLKKLSNGYLDYIQKINSYLIMECDHNDLVSSFDRYRILTATNHSEMGLGNINHFISSLVALETNQRSKGGWYTGKPVMITQNDYRLGVSNGDIGICVHHRENPGEFEVYFQSSEKWISTTRLPKTIQTAFAMTIHKSQGSEFERVAVVLDGGDSSSRILSQELIYTAITRAKREIYLLADQDALMKSLRVKTTRLSGLCKKID